MNDMRNFIIERVYEEDDTEFVFDALEVRLYDSEGNIVMAGDWYHDKIDEKIGGFFEALDYLGIPYEVKTVKKNEKF
jgi:hypothetical protein